MIHFGNFFMGLSFCAFILTGLAILAVPILLSVAFSPLYLALYPVYVPLFSLLSALFYDGDEEEGESDENH